MATAGIYHTTHASFLREPGGGRIHFVLQDEVSTSWEISILFAKYRLRLSVSQSVREITFESEKAGKVIRILFKPLLASIICMISIGSKV